MSRKRLGKVQEYGVEKEIEQETVINRLLLDYHSAALIKSARPFRNGILCMSYCWLSWSFFFKALLSLDLIVLKI